MAPCFTPSYPPWRCDFSSQNRFYSAVGRIFIYHYLKKHNSQCILVKYLCCFIIVMSSRNWIGCTLVSLKMRKASRNVGLVLTLLLTCVWFTVRGVIPSVGVGGVLAVVLLGERNIQAPKELSRSLKTLLSNWPSCPAKRLTSLINLVLLVCHHKWWLCVEGLTPP